MIRLLGAAAFMAAWLIAAPAAMSAQDPPIVEGEVTNINLSAGIITIRHGPIKNLGMTGATATDDFKVGDAIMLNALTPGMRFKFTADRVDGQLTLTRIQP